jgi:hypothetical protein
MYDTPGHPFSPETRRIADAQVYNNTLVNPRRRLSVTESFRHSRRIRPGIPNSVLFVRFVLYPRKFSHLPLFGETDKYEIQRNVGALRIGALPAQGRRLRKTAK